MRDENPHSELARLRREQIKTRQDEVFGGLSHAERAEYNRKAKRIHELEIELQASVVTELHSQPDLIAAEQRHEWNKNSETDTPQSSGRQPYRS